MEKTISKALLMILIKTCICRGTSAQNNIANYNNGLFKNPESSITEDYYGISTSALLATTPDIISKYGYPVETHTVTTEDGYLLTVHRIPGSPKAASSGAKTPVLVQHGLLATSDTFVLTGPENSVGFLLADQGYDVWLGNHRGNFYSRKHVTLSPRNPKFWNFTWHEMGVYDLPAVIDHILKTTNQEQLFYVGHSMGSTVFYVMTSTRPEYNKKIRLGVTMAPAVFFNSLGPRPRKTFIRRTELILRLLSAAGMHELAPRVESLQTALGQACRDGSPLLQVCTSLYSFAFGLHRDMFSKETVPIIFSHLLAGSSVNTAVHFAENIAADRFQVFDPTVTLGQITPEYNLSRVTAPVYLVYADQDILVPPEAVMRLERSLPNVVGLQRLRDPLAGHTDFVFAKNAKQLVYDEMLKEINRYKYIN